MSFSKSQVILGAFLLFQVAPSTFAQLQSNLLHFGDFMEFNVALETACANVTGGENSTKTITTTFSTCLSNVTKNATDLFDVQTIICKRPAFYFQCWDNMKMETLSKCGKEKRSMLPVLYGTTLSSFCGNDNGVQKTAAMRKAAKDIQSKDQDKCPESTGIHWRENCKDLLPKFINPEFCKRQEAISSCFDKITCDNISLARLVRQSYKDLRPLLQCKT